MYIGGFMKVFSKMCILITAFAFLMPVILSSCKEDPVPAIDLTVKSLNNGYPGDVSFATSATPAKKKWPINGYHLLVTSPDGTLKTLHAENGKFSNMIFSLPGAWKVELIVSDENGSSVETAKEILIKDPFEGFAFNMKAPALDEEQGVSEGVEFSLSQAYIDSRFHAFLSRIAFSVVDGEGNEIWGNELDLSVTEEIVFKDGLTMTDEGLMLCAVAYDKYNNSSVRIESKIFLNSKEQPIVGFEMYGQKPGADLASPDRFKVTKFDEAGHVTDEIIEFSNIWFNAKGSRSSGVDGDGTFINKVEYELYIVSGEGASESLNQVNVATMSAAEDEVSFELAASGLYELRMKVSNNVDLSAVRKIRFNATENKPSIQKVEVLNPGSTKIYEAVEYKVAIGARSRMPGMGALTKAVVTFDDDGTGRSVKYEVPVRTDRDLEFIWDAFIFDTSNASNTCTGSVVVKNVAGRESDPFPFSWSVWDNKPNIGMTVYPSVQIANFGQEFTVTSTPVLRDTKDSDLVFSVTQVKGAGVDMLTKAISVGEPEIIETENADYVQKKWTFTAEQFAEGDSSDINYLVSLVQRNESGYSEARKVFTATASQSFLTFDIRELKYYANQTVTIDAGWSRKNGNPLTEADFNNLKIKVDKGATGKAVYAPESSASNAAAWKGLIKYIGNGCFELTLGSADYYVVTMSEKTSGYNPDTVFRMVLVENKAPQIEEVKATAILDESGSAPIKPDEPGHVKKLKYKLEVFASIDGGDPIDFTWYFDKSPAFSEATPDRTPTDTDDRSVVEDVWLTPGEHTIYVVGHIRGKTSNKSRPYMKALTVGRLTGPTVSSAVEYTNSKQPEWSISKASDTSDQFRFQVASVGTAENDTKWSAPVSGMTSYIHDTALADGEWVLYVQERNSAEGRWSDSGYSKLTVDTVAPPVPVITVSPEYTVESSVSGDPRRTADGNASGVWSWAMPADSEAVSGYRYILQKGSPQEVSESITAPIIASELVGEGEEKSVLLSVAAKDLAGNWSSYAVSEIVIDRIAPDSPTGDTAEKWTNDRTLDFDWQVPEGCEALSGYRVVLKADEGTGSVSEIETADNVADAQWQSSTRPETPLTDYTLEVYAKDLVGNESFPLVLKRKLDTVIPEAPQELTLKEGAGIGNVGKAADSFEFTYNIPAGEDSVTYRCGWARQGSAIDSFDENGDAAAYTVTLTEDGYHTVEVRAVDRAGNIGKAATLDFYRDTTPPVITLQDLLSFNFGDVHKTKEQITAMATVSDPLDPNPVVTYEYPFAYIDTEYTYREVKEKDLMTVTAVDVLGNQTSKTIRIKVAAPTLAPWPAFSATQTTGNANLASGKAYYFSRGEVLRQYYKFLSGDIQHPATIDFETPRYDKIMLHDYSDTGYDNMMVAGVYDNMIHFISQRNAGTTRWVRFSGGTVVADPTLEGITHKLWKGVTYEASVTLQKSGSQSSVPGVSISLLSKGDNIVLGNALLAEGAMTATAAPLVATVVPTNNISGVKMEVSVSRTGEKDYAGTNLSAFNLTMKTWPGKNEQ